MHDAVLVAAALRDSTHPARCATVRPVDDAWAVLRSTVALPVAMDACRALGMPYPGGLLVLTDSLLEQCLSLLPV